MKTLTIALLGATLLVSQNAPGPKPIALTIREGTNMAAALSPDRRTLMIDLQGSLWTLPASGGPAKRVTEEFLDARQPAWAPDSRRVAFQGYSDGVWHIYVMNADGSDIHPISVNYVNEFDPAVLPDGRILFGRWEYIDKNALTIQSLWTINPDGSQESAYYANNMVFPKALLDARPVPNSTLVAATLAKHNGPPRGSIGLIDVRLGKNNPDAISNLEHPESPTFDTGDSCEPWPISENLVLFSGQPKGAKKNAIEMIDRQGNLHVGIAITVSIHLQDLTGIVEADLEMTGIAVARE